MLELLATGPQQRETLMQAGMSLVPPGRAYRRAYMKRNTTRRLRDREPREMKAPTNRDFWTGAREIVNISLAMLVRGGRVVRVGDTYTLIRESRNEGGRVFDPERHREAMRRHWIERRNKA